MSTDPSGSNPGDGPPGGESPPAPQRGAGRQGRARPVGDKSTYVADAQASDLPPRAPAGGADQEPEDEPAPEKERFLVNTLNSNLTLSWGNGRAATHFPRRGKVRVTDLPEDFATNPEVLRRLKNGNLIIEEV